MANMIKNGQEYFGTPTYDLAITKNADSAIRDIDGQKLPETYLKKAALQSGNGLPMYTSTADSCRNENLIAARKNSIFRGKDITEYFQSTDFYDAISSGTFENIFLGDYFRKTIGSYGEVICRVTGFNTLSNKFSRPVATGYGNYIAIIPDDILMTAYMNSTDTTEGGFLNTYMYKTVLPAIQTALDAAFGTSHVMRFNALLSNAVSTTGDNMAGYGATGFSVKECGCMILSESEVRNSFCNAGSWVDVSSGSVGQVPLFAVAPELRLSNYIYWLRNIRSDSVFVCFGDASTSNVASAVHGVRPIWYLK